MKHAYFVKIGFSLRRSFIAYSFPPAIHFKLRNDHLQIRLFSHTHCSTQIITVKNF